MSGYIYIPVNGNPTEVSVVDPMPIQHVGSAPADSKTVGNGDNNSLLGGFNGTNWDRWRNNTNGTLLVSAARTATTTAPTQTNYNAKGVIVVLDVTVASGIGGLTVQVRGKDPVTGKTFNLNGTPTVVTTTGTYAYEVYPGVSGTNGNMLQRTSSAVPRTFDVAVFHADGSSYTYSLGYLITI